MQPDGGIIFSLSAYPLFADENGGKIYFMAKNKTDKYSYDLRVDQVPYHVEISPFLYNGQKRFMININGADHIYAWDEEAVQLRALDDEASVLPDELEKELSDRLVKTIILKS